MRVENIWEQRDAKTASQRQTAPHILKKGRIVTHVSSDKGVSHRTEKRMKVSLKLDLSDQLEKHLSNELN